jgi:hypothetical protein
MKLNESKPVELAYCGMDVTATVWRKESGSTEVLDIAVNDENLARKEWCEAMLSGDNLFEIAALEAAGVE